MYEMVLISGKCYVYRAGTARINGCGDSRLRVLRSRKPIGFRQWGVHIKKVYRKLLKIIKRGEGENHTWASYYE